MINGTITGRLGRDPETRDVNGRTVCTLAVASDHGWGERKTTTWIRVSVWGKQGDAAARSLSKGDGVVVAGLLHLRTYQGQDGTERTSLECEANRWEFSTAKKGAPSRSNPAQADNGYPF